MVSKRFLWNAKYEIVYKWLASLSVVQCGESFQSWLDMIKEADGLMYKEKSPIISFYESGYFGKLWG
jgi:hypothetical protein